MNLLSFHKRNIANQNPVFIHCGNYTLSLDNFRILNRKGFHISNVLKNSLCKRMIGFLFHTGKIRKNLFHILSIVFLFHDRRISYCQGSGFVKHHGIKPAEITYNFATFKQNPMSCTIANPRHIRYRNTNYQGSRASQHQYGYCKFHVPCSKAYHKCQNQYKGCIIFGESVNESFSLGFGILGFLHKLYYPSESGVFTNPVGNYLDCSIIKNCTCKNFGTFLFGNGQRFSSNARFVYTSFTRYNGSIHRHLCSCLYKKHIPNIHLVHIHFLKLSVLHKFKSALGSHFCQLLYCKSRLVESPLFQICPKKKQKCYYRSFLIVFYNKRTGYCNSNQNIYTNNLYP